jgi:hypothetical protein
MIPTQPFTIRTEIIALLHFFEWARASGDLEDRRIAAKMASRHTYNATIKSYYNDLRSLCLSEIAAAATTEAV